MLFVERKKLRTNMILPLMYEIWYKFRLNIKEMQFTKTKWLRDIESGMLT